MPHPTYKPVDPIRRASSEGFTVIELVVALAIIAIIAGFTASGGIGNWLTERGLSTAVEQLRGDMQRAKLLAIRQHTNCTIQLNTPVADQYTISLNNQVVDLGEYRGNVVFTGPSMGAVTFTFTPWGTCNAGEVQLSNHGRANAVPVPVTPDTPVYRLRTSASGGITKQVWNDALGTWVSTRV